ncbi:hypothetical protein [Acrocarpospora macrocephala]|uniref:hypothetical protein n=1 Tax=Acrocarpospora macrocephala TaxID=150177 RepID=UPI0012D363A0|nr:hypothetical protein [Acrocarpospora macrocephala]
MIVFSSFINAGREAKPSSRAISMRWIPLPALTASEEQRVLPPGQIAAAGSEGRLPVSIMGTAKQ